MNHKIYTALIVAALGLGIYIGKISFSKTQTVEVEKQVTKNDVVTVVKEVVKPDGTKETLTTTTDKSVERKDSKSSVVPMAPPATQWHISASASTDFKGLEPAYGLQIEKRLLGPFSVGIRADSQRSVGLVIGYEF